MGLEVGEVLGEADGNAVGLSLGTFDGDSLGNVVGSFVPMVGGSVSPGGKHPVAPEFALAAQPSGQEVHAMTTPVTE